MRRLLLGAAAALLLLPASAGAHSIVRVSGGEISYLSSDAVSLNDLTVSLAGNDIAMRDPTVDGGVDQGTCTPGDTNEKNENIEARCPRTNVNRLRADLGEREDRLTVQASTPLPLLALGGGGADRLLTAGQADIVAGNDGNDELDAGAGGDQVNGGAGDDVVRGGAGDDVLQAGIGVDALDAGPGNDDVRVRDGAADSVACGEGADRVDADAVDQVAADCETVARAAAGAPPPSSGGDGTSPDDLGGAGPGAASGGGGGAAAASPRADKAPPKLQVGGSTSQRLRGGTVTLLATSSERGTIAASGSLEVAGLALPLSSDAVPVASAGGGVTIRVRLTRSQRRQVRRALGRRRRVTVRLDVVATDAAGNSTEAKAPVIRLRR